MRCRTAGRSRLRSCTVRLPDGRGLIAYGVRVQICVLGRTRGARSAGDEEPEWLELGPRKPRAVLTALALTPGQPVPADRVADLVWSGEPPPAAQGAMHAYISRLRKAGAPSVLETTDQGCVLRVARAEVDAHAFEDTVGAAERALAPLLSQLDGSGTEGWPGRGQVGDVVGGLDAALGTWVGEPYADLPDHPDVLAQRAGLHRVRGAAAELRLVGLVYSGVA